MNTNTKNNNTENDFTISTTTDSMLRLMRDFQNLQERAIALYEDKTGGENIINAAAELYHQMQDAIMTNICETLAESRAAEL